MVLPWLKLIGGLALIYIAIKLVVPEEENGDDVHGASSLCFAAQIVAIADIAHEPRQRHRGRGRRQR